MDTLDTKRMEMFIRVHENRPEFALAAPEGSHGAVLFEQLGQVIEDLRSRAHDQSRGQSSVRESSGNKAAARKELLRQLDAIHRTARVIAYDKPGLGGKFRTPRKVNGEALLTLARTYATDALSLKDEFIRRKLGADFIADLDAAANAFRAATNERTQGRGRQVAATAEIDRLIDRGQHLVRELRVVVLNTYADNPSKLALWESASHVQKPLRRTRPKDDGNQTPPPAED